MMNKLKSMLQEKEKVKQDAEAEIRALKAAISTIRNLEAKEREFDREKARADHNEELVERWNRFYYNEKNNEAMEGNERRNESTFDGQNEATFLHAGHATPEDRHSEYGGFNEDGDDGEKVFKRARINDGDM